MKRKKIAAILEDHTDALMILGDDSKVSTTRLDRHAVNMFQLRKELETLATELETQIGSQRFVSNADREILSDRIDRLESMVTERKLFWENVCELSFTAFCLLVVLVATGVSIYLLS